MSENLRWYTKALYGMDHVVRLAPALGWDRHSPCAGWRARDVLGHVIGVQHYLLSVIEGTPPTMNPMEDPGRHAGDEPAAAWATTRDVMLRALDRPDVLRRRVTSFRGEEEVDAMIGNNIVDTTVHAWDLARALGVDDRIDATLAARVRAVLEPVADTMRGPHRLGARVEWGPGADDQAVLLGLAGRRA